MTFRAPRWSVLLLLSAACASSGCKGCNDEPQGERRDLAAAVPTGTAAAAAKPPSSQRMDLVEALPSCNIDHRGLLFDAGTDMLIGRHGWEAGEPAGAVPAEHDGSTWIRMNDRKLTLSFVLTEATPIFVAARAQGFASRSAAVSLDDQPLGSLSLTRDQIRVASTGVTTLPADPGMHTVTLRFSGRPRGVTEPYADIDWIRIGVPDESPTTYGPPTLRDIVLPAAALSGVPHRSIAMRAPGAVRCAVRLPETARLRAAIGMLGAGEGEAEIRALRDGKKPEVLHKVELKGGEKAVWTDIDVPLAPVGRSLVTLELRAVSAPPGNRILFGDAAIVVPTPDSIVLPRAKAVVLVALNGVERQSLPPWSGGPAATLPTLSELALTGTTFDRHRGPTTVVAAVMASLLTGLSPPAHALTDPAARLPATTTTVATVARDASLRTAMFTGVPLTFRAFGFASAWERFVEHSPASGDPDTAPIDDATAWITEVLREAPEARLLAVVHARGGHPPWGITPKELEEVPPPDYAGPIEPRRSAQVLATLRKKHKQSLSPTDLDRVRALSAIALSKQDRALGALIAALKTAGVWDSTLFIVTGDVSSGPSEAALFADELDLSESVLSLPLYVRFPGGLYAGARAVESTEIVDIPYSLLNALGLAFSRASGGRDLAVIASGLTGGSWGGPQIAMLADRYSSRWGALILSGRFGAAPTLCDLSVDPTCAFNRRDVMPAAAQAIFRRTASSDREARAPTIQREPATIDPDTAAALRVWGALD